MTLCTSIHIYVLTHYRVSLGYLKLTSPPTASSQPSLCWIPREADCSINNLHSCPIAGDDMGAWAVYIHVYTLEVADVCPCSTHACLPGSQPVHNPDSPQAEVMRQNMHAIAVNRVNDIHSVSRDLKASNSPAQREKVVVLCRFTRRCCCCQ